MASDRLEEARTFFTEGNKTSDAVIRVEDHELHVDLNIISLMSPTLATEFQPRPDPNLPAAETNKAVAKLVGPVDHIVDMLTSIYPNFRNVVGQDNVEYLLPLAAKYKLVFLQQACETVIVNAVDQMRCQQGGLSGVDGYSRDIMERLLRYFTLAHQTDLVDARKRCMDKLVMHSYSVQYTDYRGSITKPTRHTEAFKQLHPSTRWEILRNRVFYLEGSYGKVTDNAEDL